MKISELPTVEQLNAAQAEWMALDPHAPKPEINRVIKLMEACPKVHLSASNDLKFANVMVNTMPSFAKAIPMDAAKERCRKYGGRVDISWCGGAGKWVAL